MEMNSKKTLEEIFKEIFSDINYVPEPEVRIWIETIGKNSLKQRGVYTVTVTLLYYKYLHPEQDIRLFQTAFEGGFSGRSFDTKHVTPVLRKLNLPSMSESGWLTRSLEQPYPYDFNYNGKIPVRVKIPFLSILDYIERNPHMSILCLKELLKIVSKETQKNKIVIQHLKNPDKITILQIIEMLTEHFNTNYKTHGGAKLPVLAFYSIYKTLIKEMGRYENCTLSELSSLTACDRTNKTSGDIEIFKSGKHFETIEIKLNKQIDSQIVRVVEEKIYKWNPERYYILSVDGINERDSIEIDSIVKKVLNEHGCQIIINGLIPTLKYYLRLINNVQDFLKEYSFAVENDLELQPVHKQKWNEIIKSLD